jgi:hypothetical protein
VNASEEETKMKLKIVLLALLPLLSSCSGDAGKFAGSWKRDLYGEGEVRMKLASNGGMELMLPSPKWPDSVDMKERVTIVGDTLVFKADTASSPCRTSDARYVMSRTEDTLRIAGIGTDTCGQRRAALVGKWVRGG